MGNYAKVAQMLDEKDAENKRLRAALQKIRARHQSLDEYADEDDLADCILAIDEIAKEALGDE